jgi:hypothetical protein
MDETLFKETVERLKAVDAVIKDLDTALRPEAVKMLRPYITGHDVPIEESDGGGGEEDGGAKPKKKPRGQSFDEEAFVDKHHTDNPPDNARTALAIYYAQFGRGPLKPNADLKPIGDRTGLILPDRIDMTLKGVKHEGGLILRKTGDGYRITPPGEKYLKETYDVTRGREAASNA